jgi:hypothetical protein
MKSFTRSVCRDTVPAIVFIVTVLFVHRAVFLESATWGIGGLDRIYSVLPIFNSLSHQEASWRVLQDMMGGLPMYNNGNFSPYYPLYFIWSGLYKSLSGSILVSDAVTLLHLFLGCFCTYLGLRLLRIGRLSATVFGLVYGLSANAIDTAVWIHFGAAYAWLPLALLGSTAIGGGDERHRTMIATVIAASMAILAFPAQIAVHLTLAAPLFGVAGLLGLPSDRDIRSALLNLSLVAGIILAINAAVLVPLALPDQPFVRWFSATQHQIGGGAIPPRILFESSVSPGSMASMVVPTGYHSLVGNIFIGLPAVLLAVAGLFFPANRRTKLALSFIGLLVLILLCGDQTVAGRIIANIPFLNQVRNPPRHMPLLLTVVAALGGMALDDFIQLIKRRARQPGWSLKTGLGALAGCFGLLLLCSVPGALTDLSLRSVAFWSGSVAVAALLIRPHMWLIYCVAGLMVLSQSSQTPPILAFSKPESQPFSQMGRLLASVPKAKGRLLFLGAPFVGDARYPMAALGSGASILQVYFAPLPIDQFERFFNHGNDAGPISRLQGADTLISKVRPPAAWDRVMSVESFDLYRNRSAYRPAYGSYSIDGYLPPNDGTLQNLPPIIDGSTLPVVALDAPEEQKFSNFNRSQKSYEPAISTAKWIGDDVSVEVDADAPAIIAINYYAGPAWRSSVNGSVAQVVRVNGLHPGVVVSAGRSLVIFHYGSRTLDWLYRIRELAIFVFALWAVFLAVRSRLTPNRLA